MINKKIKPWWSSSKATATESTENATTDCSNNRPYLNQRPTQSIPPFAYPIQPPSKSTCSVSSAVTGTK